MTQAAGGNLARFTGFADLYDSVRPSPPAELGTLLCGYARTSTPVVVDLGSGSGLSARWASTWARTVIGIEPNDDMRAVAESRPAAGVTYRPGLSDRTGLGGSTADVVVMVQAMHWMEPSSTLAEVARILRPGGVVALIDCDWPPVTGRVRAERAWRAVSGRIAELERRLAAGASGESRHRPVAQPHPVAQPPAPEPRSDVAGAPTERGGGVRSWDKGGHLGRLVASGHFPFTREVVLHGVVDGGGERFVALLRSQGSYQLLRRCGVSDEELGVDELEREVATAFVEDPGPPLMFSWRVRLGATPD